MKLASNEIEKAEDGIRAGMIRISSGNTELEVPLSHLHGDVEFVVGYCSLRFVKCLD